MATKDYGFAQLVRDVMGELFETYSELSPTPKALIEQKVHQAKVEAQVEMIDKMLADWKVWQERAKNGNRTYQLIADQKMREIKNLIARMDD